MAVTKIGRSGLDWGGKVSCTGAGCIQTSFPGQIAFVDQCELVWINDGAGPSCPTIPTGAYPEARG